MSYQFPQESLPSTEITKFLEDPSEREWKGNFSFIHGADTQFGMIDRFLLKKSEHNWDKEVAIARDAIKRINEMNPLPKFFVMCGDILDAYPFELASLKPPYTNSGGRDLREKQYKDFVQVFNELSPEIKLICVCGNHDVGDYPTLETIQLYRKQFGPDYYSFWVGGVKFVVLNSQYFYAPESIPEETEKQMKFIQTIADPEAKHIVVFQHIFFYAKDPDEEDFVSNLPKSRRGMYLETLYQQGVRYVFCGHWHRNSGGFYKDMEEIVTAALGGPLGDNPSGFRVVNVEERKISHHYVNIRDTTQF